MTYEVVMTQAVLDRIFAQASYILNESRAPKRATAWLQSVMEAGQSLEEMPRRCERAEEDAHCSYEVRAMRIGTFVLLFTIDEQARRVWVLNARSSWQATRLQDLPSDLEGLED